jgi:hypothetical protein
MTTMTVNHDDDHGNKDNKLIQITWRAEKNNDNYDDSDDNADEDNKLI